MCCDHTFREVESKVRNIDAHRWDEKHTVKLSQAPHMEHIFSCGARFKIARDHIASDIQVLQNVGIQGYHDIPEFQHDIRIIAHISQNRHNRQWCTFFLSRHTFFHRERERDF